MNFARKYILGPFYLLYKLYLGFVFAFQLLLVYPIFYVLLRKESFFPTAFKFKRFWSRCILFFVFIFVRYKKRSAFPKGPFVVVSNHVSYLDIILMYRVVPTYFSFMGKAELLRWPLFSIFFKRKMDIAVDRKNRRHALLALERCQEKIRQGVSVVIFPEGTIPEDAPNMMRFKNGAFKLAIEEQVPIVPVTLVNNWHLLSDPSDLLGPAHPGLAEVHVHETISTKGLTETDLLSLRNRVADIIEAPLKEKYEHN